MKLSEKTLERLRLLINEDVEYRSGPKLIEFFREFGFQEQYDQSFGTRSVYTDNKLSKFNGTSDLDRCIRKLFNPVNFIGQMDKLEILVIDFNQYLAFDGWQVVLNGKDVSFRRSTDSDWKQSLKSTEISSETDFLEIVYPEINFIDIKINERLKLILEQRVNEAKISLKYNAPLSVILLCGSILEGLLLSLANENPKDFNVATSSAKFEDGKIKPFHTWSLSDLINTAHELYYLRDDVKNFSHILRDYRNYIHPYQQMMSDFNPDIHTAKICLQVLNAAFAQISARYSSEYVL